MAEIFWDPTAYSNGSGSEANPRNVWPTSIGANDVIRPKRGTRGVSATQLSFGAGSAITVRPYGDPAAPRPIITITAANFGALNIAVAGPHLIEDIHFDGAMNSSTNGANVMLAQVSGGRAASCTFRNCKFTGTAYNAIRINGVDTATAADEVRVLSCEFDDIGEDAIFGGALNYEVANSRFTRLSMRSLTGDAIGFINADPTFVHIHGNYIDHSHVDVKQCIIIDTSTGAGRALIEDNYLIGYGPAPALHTPLIVDCPAIIRRNTIETWGLTAGASTSTSEFVSNLVLVRGTATALNLLALGATGGKIDNNSMIALPGASIAAGTAAVAMANGVTGGSVRNNLLYGLPVGIKSDSAGNLPTVGGNAYWGVGSRRESNIAFPEASEVLGDPMLTDAYRPRLGSPLLAGGVDLGYLRDLDGRQCRRHIGAFGAGRFLLAPTV